MPGVNHGAQRVFAEHLAHRPALDGAALDELCRAHPDLEEGLRELAHARAEAKVEPPRVAILAGRRLLHANGARDRYVLLGEAARGGMGVVLHVWDTVLERPLAMKVLDTKALKKDSNGRDEALARFLCEARIAGRLQHPGIVPIHDLGADAHGCVYFTMPFLEGKTLDEAFELVRSRGEGWSLERALSVIAKVCEVMTYAHAQRVIHRDLKPANVIAGAFNEVYVVDWGLAKVLDPLEKGAEPEPEHSGKVEAADARAGQTLDGTVAGTPPYMAPEQAEGRVEDVSFRADVYAIGALLYRLLSGRPPYAPRQGSDEPEKTMELIRRGPPTPLQRLAPEAPAELVAISERAMARQPGGRYASVEDLARDLHAFLEGQARDGERR
jgi:serine/threonine-protein kinase